MILAGKQVPAPEWCRDTADLSEHTYIFHTLDIFMVTQYITITAWLKYLGPHTILVKQFLQTVVKNQYLMLVTAEYMLTAHNYLIINRLQSQDQTNL